MGTPVIAGYDDLQLIGRGGFSVVYRARQRAFERQVAIKVMQAPTDDTLNVDVFERECRAVGNLDWCPNIVTVYDAATTTDGEPYIIMEYAQGGSLSQRLRSIGPMTSGDVTEIGAKIAFALHVAHEAGILHRDVKPANILVARNGEPLLGDFGIATISDSTRTATGAVTATVAHAAPEVLNGDRHTVESDIYSLGSTLFMLLSGSPPFGGTGDSNSSAVAMITRALTAPLPDPRRYGADDNLANVIERAMARDPHQRYQSALEMAQALRQDIVLTEPAPPRVSVPIGGAPGEQVDKPTLTGGSNGAGDDDDTVMKSALVVEPAKPGDDITIIHDDRNDATEVAGRPKEIPVVAPVTQLHPEHEQVDEGRDRRMVVLAIALVAALFLAGIGAVVALKTGGKSNNTTNATLPHSSVPIEYPFQATFAPRTLNGLPDVVFTQHWQIGQSLSKLEAIVSVENHGSKATPQIPLHLVVEKHVAKNVADVHWLSGQPHVLNPDPTVFYNVVLPAHSVKTFQYEIPLKSKMTAKRWKDFLTLEQQAIDKDGTTTKATVGLSLTQSPCQVELQTEQVCQLKLDGVHTVQLTAIETINGKRLGAARGITYESSNPNAVRVTNTGTVVAFAVGDATVTASVGIGSEKVIALEHPKYHVTGTPGKPVAFFAPCTKVPGTLTVSCDGSQSYDPGGAKLSYDWDMGDGSGQLHGVAVTHTYAKQGTYSIALAVSARNQDSAKFVFSMAVTKQNQLPVALVHCNPPSGTTVGCYSSSLDPDGYIARVVYDWGDHTTSSPSPTDHATHTYQSLTSDHTYTITLEVFDDQNATDKDHASTTIKAVDPCGGITIHTNDPTIDILPGTTAVFSATCSKGSDVTKSTTFDMKDSRGSSVPGGCTANVCTAPQTADTYNITGQYAGSTSNGVALRVPTIIGNGVDISTASPTTVDPGAVIALTALGHFNHGGDQDVTDDMTYSMTDASGVDVSGACGSTTCTAPSTPGSYSIKGYWKTPGIYSNQTVPLTVNEPTLTSFEIATDSPTTVDPGGGFNLTATGTFSYGDPGPVSPAYELKDPSGNPIAGACGAMSCTVPTDAAGGSYSIDATLNGIASSNSIPITVNDTTTTTSTTTTPSTDSTDTTDSTDSTDTTDITTTT